MLGPGIAIGGTSIGISESNGGDGGNVNITSNPVARSGGSGASTAQSSGTNSGSTGSANSTSVGSPHATTGNSGGSGNTGNATSSPTATNTALLLGFAIAFDP